MTQGRAGFLPHPAEPQGQGAEWDPQTGVGGCTLVVPGLGVPTGKSCFCTGAPGSDCSRVQDQPLLALCVPWHCFLGGCGVRAVGPGPLMPHGITPGLWPPPGTWKPGWGAEMAQPRWHSPAPAGGAAQQAHSLAGVWVLLVHPRQGGAGVRVLLLHPGQGGLRAGIGTGRCGGGLGAAGTGEGLTFSVCWRGGISRAGSGSATSSSQPRWAPRPTLAFWSPAETFCGEVMAEIPCLRPGS